LFLFDFRIYRRGNDFSFFFFLFPFFLFFSQRDKAGPRFNQYTRLWSESLPYRARPSASIKINIRTRVFLRTENMPRTPASSRRHCSCIGARASVSVPDRSTPYIVISRRPSSVRLGITRVFDVDSLDSVH
jgi:hypothetical protein